MVTQQCNTAPSQVPGGDRRESQVGRMEHLDSGGGGCGFQARDPELAAYLTGVETGVELECESEHRRIRNQLSLILIQGQ